MDGSTPSSPSPYVRLGSGKTPIAPMLKTPSS